MLVKMRIREVNEAGEIVEKEKQVSYYDFSCNKREEKDALWYGAELVAKYEVITEEKDIPKKKTPVIQETIEGFISRMKSEKPKCRNKNCTKLGWHFGYYCSEHFELLKKYLKQEGLSFKQFEKKYLRNEK